MITDLDKAHHRQLAIAYSVCAEVKCEEPFIVFNLNNQARQGAPQLTDDGNLLIVEVVSEEQRSIAPLIEL